MDLYKLVFYCVGSKRDWFVYANSKEDAEEKLLAHLYDIARFTPKQVFVASIEKRQSWICIAWERVVNYFCK